MSTPPDQDPWTDRAFSFFDDHEILTVFGSLAVAIISIVALVCFISIVDYQHTVGQCEDFCTTQGEQGRMIDDACFCGSEIVYQPPSVFER